MPIDGPGTGHLDRGTQVVQGNLGNHLGGDHPWRTAQPVRQRQGGIGLEVGVLRAADGGGEGVAGTACIVGSSVLTTIVDYIPYGGQTVTMSYDSC